jgi:hypothetical protein
VVTVALVLWIGLSWAAVAGHLHASDRDGSGQVELLAQARIQALQARADEALTLVARGNGGDFEKDYQKQTTGASSLDNLLARARDHGTPLVHDQAAAALSQAQGWEQTHTEVRKLDDGGDYQGAVTLAIGDDKASAATRFTTLDNTLGHAISVANRDFDLEAGAAGDALGGLGVGVVILTLLLLAGVGIGLQQRIAEYR